MIFTVAVVIVNQDAFVDPRLDNSARVIRDILSRTADTSQDSFEVLTANVLPQNAGEIRSYVKNLLEMSSVDWILVIGGVGFEDDDCTPEVSDPRYSLTEIPHTSLNLTFQYVGSRSTHHTPSYRGSE